MIDARIIRELEELGYGVKNANGELLTEAKMMDNDIRHWKGRINGPKDTCYEDGIFYVDI